MLGFVFIFLSAVCFGFSNAYWKSAIQQVSFLQVIFLRGLYTSAFFAFCYLIDYNWGLFEPWLGSSPTPQLNQLAWTVGLCLFSSLGLYFFVRNLKSATISYVAPISSINLFGILTAYLFLNEAWLIQHSIALLLVVFGIILIFQHDLRGVSPKVAYKSLLGSLLTSFFWGVSYTLFKFPIQWLGVLPFTLILEVCVTCMAGLCMIYQKEAWVKIEKNKVQRLAICLVFGSLFLHLAYLQANLWQIIFVGKFQLVFTLFFGQVLFRDRMSLLQWLGVSLIILSIYLVALA